MKHKILWLSVLAGLMFGVLPQAVFAQTPPVRAVYWYLTDRVPVSSISGLFAGNTSGGITHLFVGDIQGQSNGTFTFDDSTFSTDAPTVISACHANGCKALVDIGVDGNLPACISNNVNLCVSNLMNIVNTYGFDGVSIDWEQGFSTTLNDSFIHTLRAALGTKLIMQVSDQFSFSTYYGGPIKSFLDSEILLLYDMGGCVGTGFSWFDQAVFNYPSGAGSWANGASAWEDYRVRMESAGTPASELVTGIALTGRPWTSGPSVINHPLQACSGSYPIHDVNYRDLVASYGSLMANPNRDSVTHEPWIATPNGWWTSFEDATSVTDKVNYVKQNSLGGWVAFNEVAAYFPTQTPQQPLIAALVTASASAAAPTISSFTASPATITSGQSSTLSWTTSGATSLSINQGVGTVTGLTSKAVSPTVTTTYTLTATNASGSATRTVTVTVSAVAPPTISSFTATPPSVTTGSSSTLAWSVSNATSLSIDQGIGPVTGTSRAVNPAATTTYILTAANSGGSVTRSVTVTVTAAPPTISSFTSNPASVASGGSSTLAWVSSGGTACSINQSIGTVACGSASVIVHPTSTTTYTLTVGNSGGTVTRVVTVNVVSRRVGPEPGLPFSRVPVGHNLCEFGHVTGTLTANWQPGTCGPATILDANTYMVGYGHEDSGNGASESYTLFPESVFLAHNIKATNNSSGATNQSVVLGFPGTPPHTDWAADLSDPGFLSYTTDTYIPTIFMPASAGQTPQYLSIDNFDNPQYSFHGIDTGATSPSTNITWTTPAVNTQQWDQIFSDYFKYIHDHAPQVRVDPHLGSMDNWNSFSLIFQYVPSLMREWFFISNLSGYGSSTRRASYSQLFWFQQFANHMPEVFAGEGPRIIHWGTSLDNGDVHSALAMYSLVRGVNTFFDCIQQVNNLSTGCDPGTWLPVAQALGASTSDIINAVVATGHVATDGYNVFERTWTGGVAYLNMTGATQTITLPAGSKNWSGQTITTLTLGDGKGDVVLMNALTTPPPTISSFTANPTLVNPGGASTLSWSVSNSTQLTLTPGGDVTGLTSTVVHPAGTTNYLLTATNIGGSVSRSVAVGLLRPTSISGAVVIGAISH